MALIDIKYIQQRAERILGVDLQNQTLTDAVLLLCDEIDYLHGVIYDLKCELDKENDPFK